VKKVYKKANEICQNKLFEICTKSVLNDERRLDENEFPRIALHEDLPKRSLKSISMF